VNRRRIAVAAALILLATSAVRAQPAPKAAGRVNGQIITMDEVIGRVKEVDGQRPVTAAAGPRAELQAMHAALDAIAESRLIAAEAAKLQTTPQQIVEAEIESNVAVPSPELVEQTYERN